MLTAAWQDLSPSVPTKAVLTQTQGFAKEGETHYKKQYLTDEKFLYSVKKAG